MEGEQKTPGRGRSRRQTGERKQAEKKERRIKILAAAGAAVLLLGGIGFGAYIHVARKYETVFFPNTVINEIDVSGKTVEEVKEEISSGIETYQLTIRTRDGKEGVIDGKDINLRSEFDGSLETYLEDQDTMGWALRGNSSSSYEIETMIVYDEELLKNSLEAMDFMDPETMQEPENARLSDYDSSIRGYRIVEEVPGTKLNAEKTEEAVKNAVMGLKTRLDLDEAGCYEEPEITADDETLKEICNTANKYTGAVVNHTFGDVTETLNGDEIHKWLIFDGDSVTLDSSGAAAYVKELASKYNTAYKPKKLKTSYGETVTITKGNYGWRINQEKEAAAVLEIVKAGEQKTREPEYSQTAASHGANDYGTTYVEINLTAQHLFFYKDGKLLVESDFVSGNESKGWSTPSGAYPLTYKERNATLKGEGYATPVSYWMPFNGGIGMHDASWRSSFGGSIYKTNGSHGCINLPPEVARVIYENISAGMPVLCYHLEGTESGTTTKPGENGQSAEPETTAPAATEPETTAPAATEPETTAPAATEPETTAPAATEPETTAPAATEPETTAPAATEPETTAPAGPGFEPDPGEPEAGPGGPGF